MNKMKQTHEPEKGSLSSESLFPPYRVVERKIGKSTFTVYSWFGTGKEKDAVSTLARLVQNDNGQAK